MLHAASIVVTHTHTRAKKREGERERKRERESALQLAGNTGMLFRPYWVSTHSTLNAGQRPLWVSQVNHTHCGT